MGTEHRGFPVRLASPCAARWSALPGDARRRRCALCGACAYELGGLGRAEAAAAALLETPPERVQLHLREDGSVLTRDCPIGAGALRLQAWRRARWGALALALLAALSVPARAELARMREDAAVIAELDAQVEADRLLRARQLDEDLRAGAREEGWAWVAAIQRAKAREREAAGRARRVNCESTCWPLHPLGATHTDWDCYERCTHPPPEPRTWVSGGRRRRHQ